MLLYYKAVEVFPTSFRCFFFVFLFFVVVVVAVVVILNYLPQLEVKI